MSFSFSTDLSDAVSRVRQYLGDTVAADAQVEDETVQAYLDAGRSELASAAQLARDLASKYVRQTDSGVDGAYQRNSQLYSHYQQLAATLDAQASQQTQAATEGGFAGIGVYGATAQEVYDARCDATHPDNVRSRWS